MIGFDNVIQVFDLSLHCRRWAGAFLFQGGYSGRLIGIDHTGGTQAFIPLRALPKNRFAAKLTVRVEENQSSARVLSIAR